jgi:hypothetical protein
MTLKTRLAKLEATAAVKCPAGGTITNTLEDELLREKIGRRLEDVIANNDVPALEAFCKVVNDDHKN